MQTKRQGQPISTTRSLPVWRLVVFAALLLIGGVARAQELSVLHSFATSGSGADGSAPNASLVEDSSGNFYGTTSGGGSAGHGTVYKIAPDGTTTILHSFGAGTAVISGATSSAGNTGTIGTIILTNGTLGPGSTVTDGTNPSGSLILASDGNLYGTTQAGGPSGYGTVYMLSTAGSYSILHCFAVQSANALAGSTPDLSGGTNPLAGVIQGQDGNLYGTTSQGGDANLGVIFQLTLGGSYGVIHDFETGGDAANPLTALVQDAHGNLYGTTANGGTAGLGTVYMLSPQLIYSVIYNFTAPSYSFTFSSGYSASMQGGYTPNSPLALGTDGNLYGTASGSTYGTGAAYKITPLGQLTMLHYFGDGSVTGDGAQVSNVFAESGTTILSTQDPFPAARLVVGTDGNFYGVTYTGGSAGKGTVYQMTAAGQVTIIHSFGDGTVNNDGTQPVGLVEGADGNFYGATNGGGSIGGGTAFMVTSTLPLFTSPLQVTASTAAPFSYQMVATQGPDTYSVTGLPTGFSFDGTSIISGTPTQNGTFTVMLTATNAVGSSTVPLTITVMSPPVITSLLDAVGSTTSLGYNILATGSPASYAATGLPPGVSVDPINGFFYGVPTTAGTYQVTVSATNAVGTGSAIVNVTVLSTAPTADQEYMQIHSFQDGSVNGEGSYPGTMVLGSDTSLYGVTAQGGTSGDGTIFDLSPAGVATVVATFTGTNGAEPQGVIQTADGTLYGTTRTGGGTANVGTIFKLTPGGTITVLHTFGDGTVTNDGANPMAGLVLASDGNFYGTTQYGGSANLGTVFKMTPAGVVTILHSFGDGTVTNDGAQPVAALVQQPGVSLTVSGGTPSVLLYGTTLQGGAQGDGTIFIVSGAGAVFINHSFGDPSVSAGDGQLPRGPVTLCQGAIFGMTSAGGSIGKGAIFEEGQVITGLPAYTIVHNFGDGTVANDGENPSAALVAVPNGMIPTGLTTNTTGSLTLSAGTAASGGILTLAGNSDIEGTITVVGGTLSGGTVITGAGGLYGTGTHGVGLTLYGTTQNGGTAGSGTVFSYAIPTSGTATMTILHNNGDVAFTNDGTTPLGGLCFGADGNIYGTTIGGGAGSGTAYGIEVNQGNPLLVPTAPAFTCTGTIPAGLTFNSATGTFSGTPLQSDATGVYTLVVSPAPGTLNIGTGTATQTITIKLNQTYSSWTSTHTPAVTGIVGTSGNTGASGSDNVPLILKYLTGVNPNAPMQASDYAAQPAIGMDTTSQPGYSFLTLTWRQSAAATGVGVVLLSSTDMQNWAPVSGTNLISQPMGTDSAGNTTMEMGVKMTGAPLQFIRLQVTPPSP